ncbi:magnesium transporter NIPA-domain-containing protein [Kalaharituber pfeilii]|nr:magnesium transporter NIPA-domain-containing protein [Kalaharituber pfeilii]
MMERAVMSPQEASYQPTLVLPSSTIYSGVPLSQSSQALNDTTPTSDSVVVQWIMSLMGTDGDEDEAKRWSSFIGIIVAISGNVLISLALNIQKYAHVRLRRENVLKKLQQRRRRKEQAWERALSDIRAAGQRSTRQGDLEEEAIEGDDDGMGQLDGDESPENIGFGGTNEHSNLVRHGASVSDKENKMYLQSPWWWFGLVLMTIGECGNFLAYGFAPASIVSPLGVVALISNCIIAPLMLKEPFRGRDFLGVFVSIAGAVIVVLSSAPEEVKLGPDEILEAITRTAFEVYFGITCLMIVALMLISKRYGSKLIVIDLGLVALFGGYTVLSTKGISSLLSSSLYHIFTMPIAYLFTGVLVSTAILQIKYVNRALQRFDSTQVIPTQFVLFTLSVIIGSAILYRDFEKIGQDRLTKFVFGCGFTFWGVYLITSGRVIKDEDEDEPGIEEGDIWLTEGESITPSGGPNLNGNINRREGRLSLGGPDGTSSPSATRSNLRPPATRPKIRRYQSSPITVRSLGPAVSDITEASPLLEHHPDYDSLPSSPNIPENWEFPHGGSTNTLSSHVHRHSLSLIPGPIVLGYQFQGVVVDHVGPVRDLHEGTKRGVRKIKSRGGDSTSHTTKGSISGTAFGSGDGRTGEISRASSYNKPPPRILKEPEDASSGDDLGGKVVAPDDENKVRGRSSSLNLAMDVIKGKSKRRRKDSVNNTGADEDAAEEDH